MWIARRVDNTVLTIHNCPHPLENYVCYFLCMYFLKCTWHSVDWICEWNGTWICIYQSPSFSWLKVEILSCEYYCKLKASWTFYDLCYFLWQVAGKAKDMYKVMEDSKIPRKILILFNNENPKKRLPKYKLQINFFIIMWIKINFGLLKLK